MDKVKVAFIGVGGIARAHLNNLQGFSDVEFVAMCDVDESRANSAADQFGGKPYTDFKKMFDKEKIDALYICTPPFAHGEQEIIACEKGIPFFVEKPIAVDLETALKINDAVGKNGVITSVGYHWRYTTSSEAAKRFLSDKLILGALGYWMGGLPGVYWWRQRKLSGGQHVEQTTHIIDLARYMVGSDAEYVQMFAATGSMTDIPNYDVDDMSVINVKFKNGAIANITSACCLSQGYRVELEVICRDIVVEIGGGSARLIRRGDLQGRVEERVESNINPYQAEDRTFIDAVKSGDPSRIKSPYSDALQTHKLQMAASKSLETGQVEKVD
jgi:predicted dehydrogenase